MIMVDSFSHMQLHCGRVTDSLTYHCYLVTNASVPLVRSMSPPAGRTSNPTRPLPVPFNNPTAPSCLTPVSKMTNTHSHAHTCLHTHTQELYMGGLRTTAMQIMISIPVYTKRTVHGWVKNNVYTAMQIMISIPVLYQ